MIKFNKFNVTNKSNNTKARVHYSLDNRADGKLCVTIYHKDYSNAIGDVFGESVIDDTDIMTDYFDKGRVVLFESNPLYVEARTRVESFAR